MKLVAEPGSRPDPFACGAAAVPHQKHLILFKLNFKLQSWLVEMALLGSSSSHLVSVRHERQQPVLRVQIGSQRRRSSASVLVKASSQEQNVSLNPLEKAINALSVFVNTSPINEGKKRFMIGLAGQYDVETTRRFVEETVASNKVRLGLMCMQ